MERDRSELLDVVERLRDVPPPDGGKEAAARQALLARASPVP